MTYSVYSHRLDNNHIHMITKIRKGVSKEEALAIKETKMSNPKRTCDYLIVADSRVEEYEQKIADANAPRLEWLAQRDAYVERVKAQRWEELKEMKAKGYIVRDVIKYLNRGLE